MRCEEQAGAMLLLQPGNHVAAARRSVQRAHRWCEKSSSCKTVSWAYLKPAKCAEKGCWKVGRAMEGRKRGEQPARCQFTWTCALAADNPPWRASRTVRTRQPKLNSSTDTNVTLLPLTQPRGRFLGESQRDTRHHVSDSRVMSVPLIASRLCTPTTRGPE